MGDLLTQKELDNAIANIQNKIKEAIASATTETKDKLERVEAHLRDLEQKAAGFSGVRSSPAHSLSRLAHHLLQSDLLKSFMTGQNKRIGIPINFSDLGIQNNTITQTGDEISPAHRHTSIVSAPERRLFVTDLMTIIPTSTGMVEWTREASYTNNAAAQASEGAAKAESAITLDLVDHKIPTIAHFLKASKQVLDDSPALTMFLNNRMRYGVKLELENEVINGAGSAGEMEGLLHENNHVVYDAYVAEDTMLDTLCRAAGIVVGNDYFPDVVILNPTDWTTIRLLKDEEKRYLIGDPSGKQGRSIWDVPMLPTNAMAQGSFLVGALSQSCALWARQDALVEFFQQDEDNVQKNLVTIRAELRALLTVFLPNGILAGTFEEPTA